MGGLFHQTGSDRIEVDVLKVLFKFLLRIDGKSTLAARESGPFAESVETIKIWNADTGLQTSRLKGHSSVIFSVAFSPDGQWVVSSGEDQTVKLWDLKSGAELLSLESHTSSVTSVAFSTDSKQIVSTGGNDATVKVWNLSVGE